MKKVYSPLLTLLACLAFLQVANAQLAGKSVTSQPVVGANRLTQPNQSLTTMIDTLWWPSQSLACGDSLTYYNWNLPDTGFVTGNNALKPNTGTTFFHCTEFGQRFSFTGSGTITDVLIAYGHVTGTNGVTTSKIYGVTAQLPGTLKGTSDTITTGILVAGSYNDYAFSTAVPVSSNFFASAVYPNPSVGDSVALVSTKLTCNIADSSATIKVDGGIGWYFLYRLFASSAPTQDLNVVIRPVIDIPTGINEPPTTNGLSLMGAYPNPAHSATTVRYKTDRTTQANISVFDLNGKVYKTISENVSAGEHQFNLDLSDFAAGNYFYTVNTDDATMTSKFSVVK